MVLYAERSSLKELWGVDLSQESLEICRERLNDKSIALNLVRSDIDGFFGSLAQGRKFDCISCFYGLYYSENTKMLLENMVNCLNPDGRLLIVGPYGKNNLSLFSILEKTYKLPELVTWSSNHYMEEEVFPILTKMCDVEQYDFVNEIEYPDLEEIMNYWRSSTFYMKEHEARVKVDFEHEFTKNGGFVVEKHVKAYVARSMMRSTGC